MNRATKNILLGAGITLGVGGLALGGASMLSVNDTGATGNVVLDDAGNELAPWSGIPINYDMKTTDKFTGADVSATAKVYEEQPEKWNMPQETFTDSSEYDLFSASSGIVAIEGLVPGDYYVVLEATGYNTRFVPITIPDGTGQYAGMDFIDYNANTPDIPAKMSTLGTFTNEDIAYTLVNASNQDPEEIDITVPVGEDTESILKKVTLVDLEGFSTDTDLDGIYDEGVEFIEVTFEDELGNSVSEVVFDPDSGINMFDNSAVKTDILLDGLVLADKEDLKITANIESDETSDAVGANDEKWGEGEGNLFSMTFFDYETDGSVLTVNVVA